MTKSKKTTRKPRAKLVGANANVFNLAAIAARALEDAGRGDEVREMGKRIFHASSYDEALNIIQEYVDVY
jgi:hypothetical protein